MTTCPRCHKETLREVKAQNALSRRDNETYICSYCGQEEAFIDAGMLELLEGGVVNGLTIENAFRKTLGLATI